MPTYSYLYLARQLENYMMRFNLCAGPVTNQINNTQKINNSEMSTQKMNSQHVFSSDERKSKNINADESKSKMFIVNTCYLDKSSSKSVHISVNMGEVKYQDNESVNTIEAKDAKNETKDEEPSVVDN